MEIIKTNKGGDMLIFDGYRYTAKNKTGAVSIRWNCVKIRSHTCKGAVSTDIQMTRTWNLTAHNCERVPEEIEIAKFRQSMKDNARKYSDTRTEDILATGIATLTPRAAMVVAPQLSSVKRDIQRHKKAVRPPDPISLVVMNGPESTSTSQSTMVEPGSNEQLSAPTMVDSLVEINS